MRIASLAASVSLAGHLICCPVAQAVDPPAVDPTQLPPAAAPAPPEPTEQQAVCRFPIRDPARDITGVPSQLRGLAMDSVWPLSRGAGQTVAIIDTGVSRHPRLPEVTAAGDYVSSGDGTHDCDAHGTLVAGIVAAAPDPTDTTAFSGIAPDSRLISIRQSSTKFRVRRGGSPSTTGNVQTLAMAVRTVADLGATVINVSEAACAPAQFGLDDRALGAALQYAVDVKDAVVVAAAGNVGADSHCEHQNPAPGPGHPQRPDWQSVVEISSPGWYDDYVLTVGSVGPAGEPSEFSLGGPWVDVAAPGESIVSLDPARDDLVNAYSSAGGPKPISGTSFAAPVVSGVVALVRARYPQLSARQTMDHIKATAHRPPTGWSPYTGFGVVDPLAAVSTSPSTPSALGRSKPTRRLEPTAPVPPPDHSARDRALAGTGCCLALLLARRFGCKKVR